ncbi:stage V sporulation protein AA [Anaerosalibacter massiliensis]|uniref:Stage V sporulation protein AA n=1 Tax=Anaerosalibacter massiliensis TaxID=1347392 RepID=A0A9X2MFA9_9FIRM|nr:stage V sporulation protein AA [Anaerosalibacter massiliensis]MCR2042965.1 stage V sporulation protein AA [Anaerosalibacter massiliensis]
MRIIDKDQAYIKLESRYTVEPNSNVYLTDVAEIYCNNPNVQKFLEGLKVYKSKNEEIYEFISAIDILSKIENQKDNVDVVMTGEPEVLIEVKKAERKSKIFEYFKVLIVCLVLFFGAGLAIIYFHEDVNMQKCMEKIFYTITGEYNKNPLIILIPYSLGIGIGMGAFFSPIFSVKSKRKEPGPLEVEMDQYNKEIDEYIVEEIKNTEKPLK